MDFSPEGLFEVGLMPMVFEGNLEEFLDSHRCVVWTGDDRVFFFNPTMQLSVWEKPMDLRNRGDLNRILEDPPHKRKLEAATSN